MINFDSYEWYNTNCTRNAMEALGRAYRTAKINKSFNDTELSLQQNDDVDMTALPNGEYQHDSQIVYHRATQSIYALLVANKKERVDNLGSVNSFVRLQKITDKNGNLTLGDYWNVGKSGDVYAYQKIMNKNYYDNNTTYEHGYIYNGVFNSQTDTLTDSSWQTSDFMPIEYSAEKWVVRAYNFTDYSTGYRCLIYCYDENKKYIKMLSSDYTNANYFTVDNCKEYKDMPENTKYVRVQIWNKMLANTQLVFTTRSQYLENYSQYNVVTKEGYFKVETSTGSATEKTIISGCGVPNCYLADNVIHMIWSAQCNDNKCYEFHCTYDCSSNTLGTAEICKMDNELMSCQTIATHLGLTINTAISLNASIAKLNGYYYACACASDCFSNGAILKTKDFTTWEFAFEPKFDGIQSEAIFEGAIGVKVDNNNSTVYDNHLYLALRQKVEDTTTGSNPLILAKFKTDGTLVENVIIPSCCSRPSFVNAGWRLILLMPTFSRENTTGVIVGLYTNDLKDSCAVFDTGPYIGNYVQMVMKDSNVAYIIRTKGSQGVSVGYANIIQPSDELVGNGLVNALNL